MGELNLSEKELEIINTGKGIKNLLKSNKVNWRRTIRFLDYEQKLEQLQIELIKMQNWITDHHQRLVIIFEGRDAAGKGGAIRRFVEHLNPRLLRIVALPKPNATEKGQWYFQRYTQNLPKKGEIVLFDRSWYNRSVVEPVNGFCTKKEYDRFMLQVPEYERMLHEDGIKIIKFWFSITQKEQQRRFDLIKHSLLKQWKMSPVDEKAQELWGSYSQYKIEMFKRTHTKENPWVIIQADRKTRARLESIKYVLGQIPYSQQKDKELLQLNPEIISPFDPAIHKE